MMLKNQQCDDYKNEYASQLQQTNMHQNDHYHTHMPQVFQVNMSTCSNATGVSGKYVIIMLQVFQVNISLLYSYATGVSGKYDIVIYLRLKRGMVF